MNIDSYAGVGYALELLAQSEYHRKQTLGAYFQTEILPALWARQTRIYLNDQGAPTGMITWAWLSRKVEADVHATGRALTHDEWTCGDRLFFNDWVTPYGNMRDIARDVGVNVFPDQVATSLRRNTDGSVRRINRWVGMDLRQARAEVSA